LQYTEYQQHKTNFISHNYSQSMKFIIDSFLRCWIRCFFRCPIRSIILFR